MITIEDFQRPVVTVQILFNVIYQTVWHFEINASETTEIKQADFSFVSFVFVSLLKRS